MRFIDRFPLSVAQKACRSNNKQRTVDKIIISCGWNKVRDSYTVIIPNNNNNKLKSQKLLQNSLKRILFYFVVLINKIKTC